MMNSILTKIQVVFFISIVALTMVACGNDDNDYEVHILDNLKPEVRVVQVETIPQNNCGGTAEVENQVEKSRSIARTIEVGSEFELSAEGDVKVLGTGVGLGAAVATQLGYSYGSTEDISRAITVKAGPGTHMEHHISLEEVWEVGTAKVVVNNKEQTIPFSFRSDFSVKLDDSRDLDDCPNSDVAPEATDVPITTSQPAATLEPEPTPIPESAPATVQATAEAVQPTTEAVQPPNGPIVSDDIPGIPLEFGTPVTSVVDEDTKPREVYAVNLAAGQMLRVEIESDPNVSVYIAKPGTKSFDDTKGEPLCNGTRSCNKTFLAAVEGTYYLNVKTSQSGIGYTMTISEKGGSISGATDDIPGIPLEFGTPVTSVVDEDTKPREVYAVNLAAGQMLRVEIESDPNVSVYIAKPGTKSFDDTKGEPLCNGTRSCNKTFLAAVEGTYYLNVKTSQSGIGYTITVSAE
ncbi:MAG: hypothetical protein ACPGWR_14545 [Ardenticatenaceae bacterium]